MPRISHDDPDRVLACPGCDKAGDIYRRAGKGNAYAGDPEATYRCQKCGETFEEPVERDAREWKPGSGTSEPGHVGRSRLMADMTVEQFESIVHGERDAA